MDMQPGKTLKQWVEYLSSRDLPLLKQSLKDLRGIGSFETVSMAKFSNIVLADPGLTLTLLRAACAMPRSRLQDEIHTVDAATMKLGSSRTKQVIEAMKFLEECADEATKAVYMQIVSRDYHAAYQAYGMARERVDMAPEEIFTASMLQDIGALMLLLHGDGILDQCTTLDDVANQREVLGFSLRELSYALAKEWKLSSFILNSLQNVEDESRLSPRLYEVHLAGEVALAAEQGWESEQMKILMDKVAAHLHCDVEEAFLEIRDNAIHSAEETTFYGVMPAAASLPDLDEELRQSFTRNAKIENTLSKPRQIQRKEVPAATLAPGEPFSPINHAILEKVLHEAKAHLAGEFNLAYFMGLIKRGFVDGLKLNRAFFAMLDQERKYLVLRFNFGNESGIRNLRIPLDQHNLFQRLLEKPQAIRCKEANRAKLIPLLPKEFYKLINTNAFFVMTIRAKSKSLGVVYVDRYGNDFGLDETDYEKLCQLCSLLAKGFERLGR